jgi:hypothetical protein
MVVALTATPMANTSANMRNRTRLARSKPRILNPRNTNFTKMAVSAGWRDATLQIEPHQLIARGSPQLQ